MRENAAARARRYLTEGRLTLVEVRPGYARAVVRGDGAVHEVVEDSTGRTCTCPARGELCSHALALGLVVAPVGPLLHRCSHDHCGHVGRWPEDGACPHHRRTP